MNCCHISEKLFARLLKDDLYFVLGKWDYFKLVEDDHEQAAVFLDEPSYLDYVDYLWCKKPRNNLFKREPVRKESLRGYYIHKEWRWKNEDETVIDWLKSKGYTL